MPAIFVPAPLRCLGLAVLLALAGAAPRAEVLALVIGIDRYAHVADLDGAVNDALDIAERWRRCWALA